MTTIKTFVIEFLKRRFFLISWISLVLYLFYESFICYKNERKFYHLRQILGLGLCISRGTATVLNVCGALVLLPLCKKLNHAISRIVCYLWPGIFFFWLERAKSFHMTVGITLFIFAVMHSASHFTNLWNFSRGYEDAWKEINLAAYKNENPLRLLLNQAGLTGLLMLVIVLCMGVTSSRIVRRRVYNVFWYTHQLYLPFMMLLIIHPLSGALKEEVLEETYPSHVASQLELSKNNSSDGVKFVPIKSKTWLFMVVPLTCYIIDLFWRIFARNLARVDIIKVIHLPGRTISLTLSSPKGFRCKIGQYVLMQCPQISLLEWHPFTVVKIPNNNENYFVVWIRVKGDWTEDLESTLKENDKVCLLVDGPFSSPMQGVNKSNVAICVAAGVGITPFVAVLQDLFQKYEKMPITWHGYLGDA